jgi:hypothetical protein
MGRIANTIQIAKSSWKVLKADRELLLLPALSGIATLIVAATFVLPLIGRGEDLEGGTGTYLWLFLMYLALAFITIFFNAALVHAAHVRLGGGDPTVGSALRGAAGRVGRILPWAAVSATVSIILRAVEERAGMLGRIAAGIAGMAWSLVTFLVLPILVIENLGVGDAIRRSATLFRRTWGENVAAQVGFGILGFVAALPAVALVVVGAQAGATIGGVAIVVAVLWMIAVALVLSTLNGIFQTALYHYAVDGRVPGGYFADVSFSQAFRPTGR